MSAPPPLLGAKRTSPVCEYTAYITKTLGRADQGFVDINAMALSAAISGSILAVPDACFVMTMALPFGSARALLAAHAIRACPP